MSDSLSHKPESVDLVAMMDAVVRKVEQYSPNTDKDRLWSAFHMGHDAHDGQKRRSGEPFFIHALTVIDILSDLRMDADTIIAGLLHDVVEDTDVSLNEVRTRFGDDVARMVDGVTKISDLRSHNPEARKAENYRKLVFTIAQDPRTVLIKMADRLHNMRTVQYLTADRQQGMARETVDVYAPLAHRFGLAKVKWELEDRAFKVLDPEAYYAVEQSVSQTRAEREILIEDMRRPLFEAMTEAGIKADITGRPKHFWSIHNKMLKQEVGIDGIYDLLAMRILVDSKVDCYHALGIVHSLFTPVQDRIKDFVATPKANMYQSLHTTVRTPTGRFLEIQIRTHDMHERSEIGIAAHWMYKEGEEGEAIDFTRMVEWLRQLMEFQEDVADPREFMESMKIDLFQDEVFAFSPAGDLFQFPRGSTPLDFAFEVHSEVGLHCVGAKVNGRIVSLTTPLENRDTVEILTNAKGHPSTSWLGIVKTSKSKHHIRRWIRSTQFLDSMRLGREILERELRKLKITLKIDKDLLEVSQELGYNDTAKMLAAMGRGDLTSAKVLNRIAPVQKTPPARLVDMGKDIYASIMRRKVGGVRIQGLDSLMVRYARCCEPIPGDEVIGVVTRGRGVSVHRLGCANLASISSDRMIEVSWDVEDGQTFLVKLIAVGQDRSGLLADVSEAISGLGTNIQSGDFKADGDFATVTLLVEVRNLNKLEKILNAIRRVPSISKVERYQLP